ncbi:equilibrative nucleoside transporter 2-like [Pungitius pungitius]|uniref:equilibrative nucleoside transporter 2-like n=1 Tax=Pungitius pungitius TaxID=134920 RepID=UPI002E123966
MSKQGRPVNCEHVERCVIVVVLGVGSLLPWNFFIIASQYFHQRLAAAPNATCNATSNATCNATSGGGDYSYGLWMPLASNLPLLILSLFNTLWPSSWSGCDLPAARCKRRGLARDPLVVSSMASIIACFAVTAVLVNVAVSPRAFFIVTMATIVLINMCSGVLVGRLLGVVGLLFQQYLPWFMSGQGGSGLFAALVMLVSIVSEVDALVYFITPCIVTVITLLCYLRLLKLATSPRTHSHTRGDAVDSPLQDVAPQGPPGITEITALSSSSDAPEEGGDQKRDENLEKHCGWHVFNKIRCMALCVTAVFLVTLSVFPVITSRVRTVYKDNAAWDKVFTCVCCFIVFSAMDLLGRVLTNCVQWPSKESWWLPVAVASRGVFVPLLVMTFRLPAFLCRDWFFISIMATFSFSNGYLASLCVAYAPQLVRGKDREAAGLLMSLSIALGLSLGALVSFCIVKALGVD